MDEAQITGKSIPSQSIQYTLYLIVVYWDIKEWSLKSKRIYMLNVDIWSV